MRKLSITPILMGLLLYGPLAAADNVEHAEGQSKGQKVAEIIGISNNQREKSSAEEVKKGPEVREGFFSIPGTETDIRFYGAVRAQVAYSLDSGFGHSQAVTAPFSKGWGGVAWDDDPLSNRSGQIEFDMRATRLGFETITPSEFGDVRTLIETDFYGAGGSKLSTNSVSLRLRHALLEVGPLMIGQYWSNSTDLGSSPWLMDLGGPVGLPAVARVPQIRYTHELTKKQTFSLSFEQPIQDFSGAETVSFVAGANNISTTSVDEMFEVVGRYTFVNNWMRQSFSGVGRKLTYDTGDSRDSKLGYAVTYQGKFNTFGKSNFYYSMTYSEGANNYITQQNTVSAILEDEKLHKVKGKALNIGYTQVWKPRWTSTFNFGMNEFDIPKNTQFYQNSGVLNESKSFFTNLMWNPLPKATLGVEYQYVEIKNDHGRKGDGQRLYITSMYGF